MQMKALKVVKVDNRVENAKALLDNYSNEIKLLKSLQGNRFIINLENSEVFPCIRCSCHDVIHTVVASTHKYFWLHVLSYQSMGGLCCGFLFVFWR